MKQLLTIALGVALGIAGYVVVNRYLHTHSATVVVQRGPAKESHHNKNHDETVVVQRRAAVNNDENTVKKA